MDSLSPQTWITIGFGLVFTVMMRFSRRLPQAYRLPAFGLLFGLLVLLGFVLREF